MELRRWSNYDQAYVKDFFRDQSTNSKFSQISGERDAAIAERDRALTQRKIACNERDAALLQRDVAYADRNTAWMERDKAISALTIICNNGNDREGAAKLLEVVNFFANRNHVGNNMLALPSPVEELGSQGDEQAIKRHGKYLSKGGKKEIDNMKRKANVVTSQEYSRKKRKQQRSEGKLKKSKLGAVCKSLLASVPPYDLASTPVPLCSCTGTNRQCYRWGSGGWQSSCCTTFLSAYPLPLNHARRNSRVAGRKMSGGAFKKLLDRLAEAGVDITQPVDLKNHWAKHGTNKYVTVK